MPKRRRGLGMVIKGGGEKKDGIKSRDERAVSGVLINSENPSAFIPGAAIRVGMAASPLRNRFHRWVLGGWRPFEVSLFCHVAFAGWLLFLSAAGLEEEFCTSFAFWVRRRFYLL
ncbi:hypothetical protein TNCV_1110601 [Trichonephila clavipes]|nr:hypothetical protein TNCV_1110601 [Trichonephila clavipes]